MWDPYAEFQSATLPNGLKVYVAHWPGRPWEAVSFMIHSGAEQDPVGLEGLAHFVEHLVSENGEVTANEVRGFFEDHGGSVNLGETGYHYTQYKFFTLANASVFSRALSLFGQMLISAKLASQVERERQVVTREFHQKYPMEFQRELDEKTHNVLYKGHSLERFLRPLGNPTSVARITTGDLQEFYDRHYTPRNMSVVCVGGLELDEVVRLLRESPFALEKAGKRTRLLTPVGSFGPLDENRYTLELSKHVSGPIDAGGFRSLAKIPGTTSGYVVKVLRRMFHEVIREEIREKRAWSYSAGSGFNDNLWCYEFEVGAKALALNSLSYVEAVFEEIISSMAGRVELFERERARFISSLSMIDHNGQGVRDSATGDLWRKQRIISLAEEALGFQEVTMDDIRETLHWLNPEYRWSIIVKP